MDGWGGLSGWIVTSIDLANSISLFFVSLVSRLLKVLQQVAPWLEDGGCGMQRVRRSKLLLLI